MVSVAKPEEVPWCGTGTKQEDRGEKKVNKYGSIEELDDARPKSYEEFRGLVHALCLDKDQGYLRAFPEEEVKKWLEAEEQEADVRDSYDRVTNPERYVPHAKSHGRTPEETEQYIQNYKNGNYLRSATGECAYAFGLMFE